MSTPERLALVAVLVYSIVLTARHVNTPQKLFELCGRDFHEPAAKGSCLCRAGDFCMCTPGLAADVILELEDSPGSGVRGVVFVVRGDGRGLAMIGGFVKVGESVEAAVRREALEETGLELTSVRQWCLFSDAKRDPRGHTAAMVHVARATGVPRAADDAKAIRVVPLDQLQQQLPRFAFDHGSIVAAYMDQHHPPAGQPHPRTLVSPSSGSAAAAAAAAAAACLRTRPVAG